MITYLLSHHQPRLSCVFGLTALFLLAVLSSRLGRQTSRSRLGHLRFVPKTVSWWACRWRRIRSVNGL